MFIFNEEDKQLIYESFNNFKYIYYEKIRKIKCRYFCEENIHEIMDFHEKCRKNKCSKFSKICFDELTQIVNQYNIFVKVVIDERELNQIMLNFK